MPYFGVTCAEPHHSTSRSKEFEAENVPPNSVFLSILLLSLEHLSVPYWLLEEGADGKRAGNIQHSVGLKGLSFSICREGY